MLKIKIIKLQIFFRIFRSIDREDCNDNSDINVNVFASIENNMNVYNKLMNFKMNKRCKNKNDNFRYYNSDKNIKGF